MTNFIIVVLIFTFIFIISSRQERKENGERFKYIRKTSTLTGKFKHIKTPAKTIILVEHVKLDLTKEFREATPEDLKFLNLKV